MNSNLILILSSIKNTLGKQLEFNTSTDSLCDVIYDADPERCTYISCVDCIIGYKDSTHYAHQIIQTWKVL